MLRILFLLLPHASSKCEWPLIDGSKLSFDEFFKLHWEKRPVVFTNMLHAWPAVAEKRWHPEKLLASYGHHVFNSTQISGNNRKGSIGEFYMDGLSLQDFFNTSSRQPASWFLQPGAPLVQELFKNRDFFVPEGLKGIHRDGPFVSLGQRKQWNPFHQHEHNWFALVHGSKRWYAVAPDIKENLQFDLQDVNVCKDKRLRSFKRCDLEAGQVVYVPSNFEHGTCVLKDHTMGVAFIGSSATASLKLEGHLGAHVSLEVKLGNATAKSLKVDSSTHDDLLSLAAGAGHTRLVKLLFKEGMPSSTKISAITSAVRSGHQSVLGYLGKKVGLHVEDEGMSLLHIAAIDGHVPLVQWLEKKGLKAKRRFPGGFSPAFAAAGGGHIPVLKHFITEGVDIRSKDAEGMTALHFAALFDFYYIIRFLNEEVGMDLEELLAYTKRENLKGLTTFISRQMKARKGEISNTEL